MLERENEDVLLPATARGRCHIIAASFIASGGHGRFMLEV